MNSEKDFIVFKNYRIRTRSWLKGKSRKTALICHGISEHSGRYEELAHNLNKKGFSVFSYDHIGHGESEGERGTIDTFQNFVDLLAHVVRFISSIREDRITLISHSMGGLIVLHYLDQHNYSEHVNSLIFSSPAVSTKLGLEFLISPVAKFLAKHFPNVPIGTIYRSLTSDEKCTNDPALRDLKRSDPLMERSAKIKLLSELMDFMLKTKKIDLKIMVPTLLLLAGKDKVVNSKRAKTFFNKFKNDFLCIQEISGAYHEVFHDLKRNDVFQQAGVWLTENT